MFDNFKINRRKSERVVALIKLLVKIIPGTFVAEIISVPFE